MIIEQTYFIIIIIMLKIKIINPKSCTSKHNSYTNNLNISKSCLSTYDEVKIKFYKKIHYI